MADPKNEPGKTSSTEKRTTGSDSGTGSKISAGTSVGNVGQPPMPHAHEDTKPAQSSTLASHTSKPLGGTDRTHSAGQSDQDRSGKEQSGSAGKSQQGAGAQASEQARNAADQAREKASDAYEGASEWAQDTYERVSGWASGSGSRRGGQSRRTSRMRSRSGTSFGNMRGGVQQYVAENPMVVGLVGLAAGLALGALLPRTRRENEVFGEWADEVRSQGLRYAREAADMGREYIEESLGGDDAQSGGRGNGFQADQPGTNRH
ncbi:MULTISPECIES: hypothetical protein [Microvirga]|uniref:hypothetical protein n=1 Tax=Microvirga TaxID=186650 RepID=UPI001CFE7A8E|nr:hypothetical protein [Microvirga lenta]MCB5173943.1 hypothetical protein [Microvirga lenta]